MPIRITGLNSGLDTEAIISELVSAYRTKEEKYEKAQTKLSWKQDAWKDLNIKVKSLYDNISNLRFSAAWTMKKTTVSDTTKASITASASCVDGTQSLKINQLAKGTYITSGKMASTTTSSTKLSELGFSSQTAQATSITGATLPGMNNGMNTTTTTLEDLGYTGTSGEIQVKNSAGEVVNTLSVTKDTTVAEFTSMLDNLDGISAHFGAVNDRILVSADSAGAANGFTLDDGNTGILSALGLTEGSGASIVEAQDASNNTIQVKDSEGKVVKTISVTEKTTVAQVVSELNGTSGISASYDATNQRIFVTASKTGVANGFSLEGNADVLKALGLNAEGGATVVDAQDAEIELNGASFTSASNTFSVNGLSIECLGVTNGSEISVTTARDTQAMYDQIKDFLNQYNELITEMTSLYSADSAKGYEPLTDEERDAMTETEVEKWEATIKSALLRRDDTLDGIMSVMKNAMSTSYYVYNGNAITFDSEKRYYTSNGTALKTANGSFIRSAADLTNWAKTNDVKKYTLASFGIMTEAYASMTSNSDRYAYHINGDADDDVSKNNSDALMSMLNSDPDTVVGFMKQLISGVYSAIDTKMKSVKGLSSAYTIYNDIEMAREYSDYTDTIAKWEEKLTDLEDSYYSKFAAMESALATLNSQSSALGSLLS